ncbi:MAG: hypothetical protein AAGB05_04925 [Pseudomonadota bacterium]
MYEDGDGAARDPAQALAWYDTGLDRGDPWAGTNGARLILRGAAPDATLFDATKRAGRAASLGDGAAATRAHDLLSGLSDQALFGGAQALLVDLGADIAVDGVFGLASLAALRQQVGAVAAAGLEDRPLDLLLRVAAAHWRSFRFHADLL